MQRRLGDADRAGKNSVDAGANRVTTECDGWLLRFIAHYWRQNNWTRPVRAFRSVEYGLRPESRRIAGCNLIAPVIVEDFAGQGIGRDRAGGWIDAVLPGLILAPLIVVAGEDLGHQEAGTRRIGHARRAGDGYTIPIVLILLDSFAEVVVDGVGDRAVGAVVFGVTKGVISQCKTLVYAPLLSFSISENAAY